MRGYVLTAVSVLGLVLAGSAFAQNTPLPQLPSVPRYNDIAPTNPPAAPNGEDTIVCNYQTETGSHMITSVCRTLRAWKQMRADAQEFMNFEFRGSHQCGEGGCGGHGHVPDGSF